MRTGLILGGLLLASAAAIFIYPGPQTVYYVGPSGSDVTGDGSVGNPWATVPHVCSAVSSAADVTVKLLSGAYYGVSWTLGSACSGLPGHPLTVIANSGINTVTLVGGQQVNAANCVLSSGSIYKCPVPATANFYTAFEGDVRLQWARTPNISINASYPASFEPMFTTSAAGGSYTSITYTGTDFDPSTWVIGDVYLWMWAGNSGIETGMQWFSGLNQVTGINTTTHTVTVGNNFKYNAAGGGTQYMMMGDLAMLDQQGEWYLDRNDVHGAAPGGQHYFYVWPTATPISGENFVYPTTSDVLTISGASNIVLDSFEIEVSDHTSWYRYATWGTGNPGDFDPAVCTPYPAGDCGMAFEAAQPNVQHALLHMVNATNITAQNLHLKNGGMKGIYCGPGACTGVVETKNWIEHIADDGIDHEGLFCGQGDVNNANTISCNKIQHVGELVGHGAGIRMANSGHNSITNNEIDYGPRNAVYVTDIELPGMNDGYAWNNTIKYTKATFMMQDSNDAGAFGVFEIGNEPPTVVAPFRTNFWLQTIADHIGADPRVPAATQAPNAIFTDNQTHGQTIGDFVCTNMIGTHGVCQRVNDSGNISENNGTTDHLVWDVQWGTSAGSGTDIANVGLCGSFPY